MRNGPGWACAGQWAGQSPVRVRLTGEPEAAACCAHAAGGSSGDGEGDG